MKRYKFDRRDTINCSPSFVDFSTSVEQQRHLRGRGAFGLAEIPPLPRVGVVPDTRRGRRGSPSWFHELARGRAIIPAYVGKGSYLERAVSDMGRLRQMEGEDERAFARRFSKQARMCAGGFKSQELMKHFLQGVPETIRSLFRLKRSSFQGLDAFWHVRRTCSGLGGSATRRTSEENTPALRQRLACCRTLEGRAGVFHRFVGGSGSH